MAGSTEWELGFAKAPSWGTAVAVGADDGLLVESESMPEGIPEPIKDDNVGDALSGGTYQGNVNVDGSVVPQVRFLGTSMSLLAFLMGNSGSGGANGSPEEVEVALAFLHHMMFAPSNTGLYGTLVIDKNVGVDKLYEYPTAKIVQMELAHSNSRLMATMQMLANKCERASGVNTTASFAAVTHITKAHAVIFQQLDLKLTEVTGTEDNLDGADEIKVTDLKITVNRNLSGVHESGSTAGNIGEPETDGLPEAALEFTVADHRAVNDLLIEQAQTVNPGRVPKRYKATVTWNGPAIPGSAEFYKLQFDFPALTIDTAPPNAGGPGARVPVTFTMSVQTPSLLPDGTDWAWVVAGTNPFRAQVQNETADGYIVA